MSNHGLSLSYTYADVHIRKSNRLMMLVVWFLEVSHIITISSIYLLAPLKVGHVQPRGWQEAQNDDASDLQGQGVESLSCPLSCL